MMSCNSFKLLRVTSLLKPSIFNVGQSHSSVTFASKKLLTTQPYFKYEQTEKFSHAKSNQKDQSTSRFVCPLLFFSCGVGLLLWRKEEAKCDESKTVNPKWKGKSIKLYQYQTCPFCSKTRYFLQAYDIPFEIVEVHPIFKKEISFAKSKKVPIVVVEENGEALELQDSSYIISVLGSYLINDDKSIAELAAAYPRSNDFDEKGKIKETILNKHILVHDEEWKGPMGDKVDPRKEEIEWRMWADDYLVHIISPNVYRSLRESYQAFNHHVKQGRFNGTWEGFVAKYAGAFAMWMVSKKLKKKYNVSEDARLDLYKACNHWMDAIGKNRQFMGGDKPNLADISVFGVLSVMEGLDSFEDLLVHSRIKRWYYRTKQAIIDHNPQTLFVA